MRLINGKFYDEKNNIIPLRFGDKEQILLIKLHEKKLSALSGEGLEVSVFTEMRYAHRIEFVCLCNEAHVYASSESDYEDDFSDLIGRETCYKCKREYDITLDKGVFLAKLIS